ncbi:hypothetical protein EDB19DRAFT_1753507 [Suillus lakei]|nr:hypothetical protein EDB19DRAFT_1753507 [Suillus lakei]
MFTRLSTAFVVLLGLTTLVNAGIVPAARAVGELDKRNNVIRVAQANDVVLAREESPEPDPGKPVVLLAREESPEPDPGKPVVLLAREESPVPDPGAGA